MALEGATLVLWMENVRRGGLVFAGPLRLHGLTGASSREPRLADDSYPLQGRLAVQAAHWSPGRLTLDCKRESGPGDAHVPQFTFAFASVSDGMQPSLGRTLRGLAGDYPGRSDRGRRLPGPGVIPIAALNGLG